MRNFASYEKKVRLSPERKRTPLRVLKVTLIFVSSSINDNKGTGSRGNEQESVKDLVTSWMVYVSKKSSGDEGHPGLRFCNSMNDIGNNRDMKYRKGNKYM